jgi:phosphopentomutase
MEPCGLSQMIASRYGTVPIVRATGGLRDTIIDYGDNGNGFVFQEYNSYHMLDKIKQAGAKVIGIGKIEDIFSKKGITHAIHTGSNKEGLELTINAINGTLPLDEIKYEGVNITDDSKEIIFTNLVDTDMLFGHRNDAEGYGKAIEEIDDYLETILPLINENDLLIITADHGCDPTVEGTDHTREFVPVLYYSKNIEPKNLGLTLGFDSIAKRVNDWLF